METSTTLSYLGMFIKIYQDYITIDMSFYIDKYRMNPSIANAFAIQDSSLLPEDKRKLFHTTIAKLLYICKWARPDIMTIVSFLCIRMKYANEDDKKKLEHVLGF